MQQRACKGIASVTLYTWRPTRYLFFLHYCLGIVSRISSQLTAVTTDCTDACLHLELTACAQKGLLCCPYIPCSLNTCSPLHADEEAGSKQDGCLVCYNLEEG